MEEQRIILFNPEILQQPVLQHDQNFLMHIQQVFDKLAEFPGIIAQLYQHVDRRSNDEGYAEELHELCTLLPGIKQNFYDPLPLVPACDLADDINDVARQCKIQVDRLTRMCEEFSNDPILIQILTSLISYYEKADTTNEAYICGVDGSYRRISHERGLELLRRDMHGNSIFLAGNFGESPGVKIEKIWAKVDRLGCGQHIHLGTGRENAAVKITQMLYQNPYCNNNMIRLVAACVKLYKLSHVKPILIGKPNLKNAPLEEKYRHNLYYARKLQFSYFIDGALLQYLLELEVAFKNWQVAFTRDELMILLEQPLINVAILAEKSGLDPKEQQEMATHLKVLQSLIKDYSPQKVFEQLPKIRSRIEHYSLCHAIISSILCGTTDGKADNFMLCWDLDPKTDEYVYYLVFFDLDKVFEKLIYQTQMGHRLGFRCVLMLFNLDFPFDEKFRKELLAHPAIYVLLTWMMMINNDEKKFINALIQRVYNDRDQMEDGEPSSDQPLKIPKWLFAKMEQIIKDIQRILSRAGVVTLRQVVDELITLISRYYKKTALQFDKDDIRSIYPAIVRGPTFEEMFPNESLHELSEYDSEDQEKDLLVWPDAVGHYLANYNYEDSVEGQFKLLEFIGHYFPHIKKINYTKEQINALLLDSTNYMLFNAMSLLLRCGGDITLKDDLQRSLLHRVLSTPRLDKIENNLQIIELLMLNPRVNVNDVCVNKTTPLMTFLLNAKDYDLSFIQSVMKLFAKKKAQFNQRLSGGTPLDVAVGLESRKLFASLVSHGAYATLDKANMAKAVQFIRKRERAEEVIASVKVLSVCNPNLQYKRALTMISKPEMDRDHQIAIQGEFHEGRYLHKSVVDLLFDSHGNYRSKPKKRSGDFNVIDIKFNNELLFYAIDDLPFPGSAIAVSCLHRVWQSYASPYAEIFQCTNVKGEVFPILLLGAVSGIPLTEVNQNSELKEKVFRHLDRNNYTKFIFIQFLMAQVTTGSEKDIIVVESGTPDQPRYSLVYALNPLPFTPDAQKEYTNDPKAMFRYLHSLFGIPLDPKAIEELSEIFKSQDPFGEWLSLLEIHEKRMQVLLCKKDNVDIKSLNGHVVSLDGVPFAPGTMYKLFVRAQSLLEILKQHAYHEFTGWDFLQCALLLFMQVEKPISASIAPMTPETRKKSSSTLWNMISPRRSVSDVKKDFVQDFQTNEKIRAQYNIAGARDEHNNIKQDSALLAQTIEEINRNDFTTLNKMSLDYFKQAAVKSIVWKGKDPDTQLRILLNIVAANIKFTDFELNHCIALNDEILKDLLRNSPGLISLTLRNCHKIRHTLPKFLQESCPFLEVLHIGNSLVKDLSIGELKYLRVVLAYGCNRLKNIRIDTVSVTEIDCHGSAVEKLFIHPRSCNMTKLNVNGCVNLDPVFLEKILLSSTNWQEFQHNDVRPCDARGYVQSVAKDKIISPATAKSLVHNCLLNFYGSPINDEQFLHIIEQLTNPKVQLLLPSQQIQSLDLSGCLNVSPLSIVTAITKARSLEHLRCQFSLRLNEMQPVVLDGSDNADIKRIIRITNGNIVIFYNNATYQVWDPAAATLLREGGITCAKGVAGKQLTDADLLPNGDLIVCCDDLALVLSTVSWKCADPIELEPHLENPHLYVRVVGKKGLALGGQHLNMLEITPRGFTHTKTTPNINVKTMIVTPNNKILCAQTSRYGTFVWRFDNQQTEFIGKEFSQQIETLMAIDNMTVLLKGKNDYPRLMLNLRSKQITPAEVGLKAEYEDFKAQLIAQYPLTENPIGEPCVTPQGDLIFNYGKFARVLRCEVQEFVFDFCKTLPVSLQISLVTDHNQSYLQISHAENLNLSDRAAMKGFNAFIDTLFSDPKFKIIRAATSISIRNIPEEELLCYQMMFESFVSRATEHRKSLLSPLKSPRSMSQDAGLSSPRINLNLGRFSDKNEATSPRKDFTFK